MTKKQVEPEVDTSEHEEGGFFSSLTASLKSALYTQPASGNLVAAEDEAPKGKRPSQPGPPVAQRPAVAPARPTGGIDEHTVEMTQQALFGEIRKVSPAVGSFLITYTPLSKRMDPATAVQTTLEILQGQSIAATDIALGITQCRERLNGINQEAESRFQQTMRTFEGQRQTVHQRYQQRSQELQTLIQQLDQQLGAARQELSELAGKESAEVAQADPQIQQATITHQSFNAAYTAVLTQITTIGSKITEGSGS